MNTDIKTLGFIGLGTMGAPMAGHLLKSGLPVIGYNRSREKAQAWQAQYPAGRIADEPSALAQQVDVVALCVGNDDDVRTTVAKLLPHLKVGTIIIDHTTTSATLAREMHALCAARGVAFIDAPVSGGQAGAVNGTLTVMAGGDAAAFIKIQPIIAHYSQHQRLFGAAGAGQGAKMVNQILVASVLQGLAEGITLAQSLQLPITELVDTLKRGAANSWQLDNRGVTMSEGKFDFGFAVDWAIKDLNIVLAAAHELGLNLPLTQDVLKRYQAISARGHGREDTSALIRQFENPPPVGT